MCVYVMMDMLVLCVCVCVCVCADRPQELIDLIQEANGNRRVTATALNSESSRSHSMFTLYVEKTFEMPGFGQRTVSAKLNLVDLVGALLRYVYMYIYV